MNAPPPHSLTGSLEPSQAVFFFETGRANNARAGKLHAEHHSSFPVHP